MIDLFEVVEEMKFSYYDNPYESIIKHLNIKDRRELKLLFDHLNERNISLARDLIPNIDNGVLFLSGFISLCVFRNSIFTYDLVKLAVDYNIDLKGKKGKVILDQASFNGNTRLLNLLHNNNIKD